MWTSFCWAAAPLTAKLLKSARHWLGESGIALIGGVLGEQGEECELGIGDDPGPLSRGPLEGQCPASPVVLDIFGRVLLHERYLHGDLPLFGIMDPRIF